MDQGYSPLIYTGMEYSGILAYQRIKGRNENIWLFQYTSGNLQNQFHRNVNTVSVNLTAFTFHKSNSESRVNWGWANNNSFHTRHIDDFQNFNGRTDYFSSFGPALKYFSPFEWKEKNISFQVISHIQLLGFIIPSGYVSSLPQGFGYEQNSFVQSVLQSVHIFYPGSAVNAGLWPGLQWNLESGNSIGFNYLYEFTWLRGEQLSSRSISSFFLTLNMALN